MDDILCLFLLGRVISKSDDVTVCEGKGAVFTCVLNTTLKRDVHWYRFINSTGTTVIVDPDGTNITYNTIGNNFNNSLIITNAKTSYTGYFWIGTPHFNACIASLTVRTSTYVKI